MTTLIFANGDMPSVDWVDSAEINTATALIAVDGGARHLYRLNQPPTVVIGDGDSLSAETDSRIVEWLKRHDVPQIAHNPEKDETDLELGIRYAIEQYVDDIAVYGAFGGRVDQMLANMLLLAHPAYASRHVELRDQFQRVWLLQKTGVAVEIFGRIGDTISLIPVGGDTHIQQTTGLKWPLVNSTLAFGPARGISNVLLSTPATITIKSGALLCVHIDQNWKR